MSIPKCYLTAKGEALLAKTPEGQNAKVTRWKIGTGSLAPDQKERDQTGMVQEQTERPISETRRSGRQCLVLGQFSNMGLESFRWEELGLFATDPDEGEILFAYGNARGAGEIIEAGSEKTREFVFGMELTFSGDSGVSAEISETLIFATKEDLKAKADLVGGKVPVEQIPETSYTKSFQAEDWSPVDQECTLTIPKSEHRMSGTMASCQAFVQVDGHWLANVWAAIETYAEVSGGGDIVLHYPDSTGYAGRAVLSMHQAAEV